MTRRDFLIKWTVYAVALLPVWFMDQFVLPRIPLFGVSPMLLPLGAVAVAVLEGPAAGAGFGLAVGVVWNATLYGAAGVPILALALLGMGAGIAAQYVFSQTLAGCFLCSAAALVLIDGGRILWGLASGDPIGAMLRVAIPEILWSLVFVAPIYFIFRWVHSRTQASTLF